MNNLMTQALDRALTAADAEASQPQLLEINSQELVAARDTLSESKSDEARAARGAEMIGQQCAALMEDDSRNRISRLRSICSIAAAILPEEALTPGTSLVEEWRAANATIDRLEDEKQQLRDSLFEAEERIERLESMLQINARAASRDEAIQHVVALAVPYGQNSTRISLRSRDTVVNQTPR